MGYFQNGLMVGNVEVDLGAKAEIFPGMGIRYIVTADDPEVVRDAAVGTAALPSTVIKRPEGGVERYLKPEETPDGRPGAIVQLWVDASTPREKFEQEMSYRIRQGTLVELETEVFDDNPWATSFYDTMATIGECGDGYQTEVEEYGRQRISIPLMSGDFLIDRKLGVSDNAILGGNLWIMCEDKNCLSELRRKTLTAVQEVEGTIAPFKICSAGSKPLYPGQEHPEIGPSTNHSFCPSLKGKIPDFKVPEGIGRIPEVVFDGMTIAHVRDAMGAVIDAVKDVSGVKYITAGDYGGKLGIGNIYLKDLGLN